ncbi:MAG: deoxyribonuclease IV [Bryobacterales bacterium]|nr:deoxyribonuclease IV [Bryobacterales bacterium]
MRIGAHYSVAGSLEGAVRSARAAGANTMQIFTASPRMWRASRPGAEDIKRLKAARAECDVAPLVSHANYLINLASADETIRGKSILAFREELLRCILMGVDYLVVHPGNYKDQPLEAAIGAAALALADAAQGVPESPLMVLLENTAGQGASLGSRVEEIAAIRSLVDGQLPYRVGYCLDTCHAHAAGLDFVEAAAKLGFDNVPVIHTNDSKNPHGSRVDRHDNIGKGHLGEATFRAILTHPELRKKAFILETPFDNDGDDARDIAELKRLASANVTLAAD